MRLDSGRLSFLVRIDSCGGELRVIGWLPGRPLFLVSKNWRTSSFALSTAIPDDRSDLSPSDSTSGRMALIVLILFHPTTSTWAGSEPENETRFLNHFRAVTERLLRRVP